MLKEGPFSMCCQLAIQEPLKGPEGSRWLRLPDFKTDGMWRW